MSEKVLCKDCKHSFRTISNFIFHGSSRYAWSCRKSFKPDNVEDDPVVGPKKVKGGYDSCSVARIGNDQYKPLDDHRCGENGRFWEPKHKRDLFKYIKHVSV